MTEINKESRVEEIKQGFLEILSSLCKGITDPEILLAITERVLTFQEKILAGYSTSQSGLRWVKASEGLPEVWINPISANTIDKGSRRVHFNYDGESFTGRYVEERWNFKDVFVTAEMDTVIQRKDFDKIEWLDESSISTRGETGLLFGKFLAEHGWKPYDENAWENSDDDTASTETLYNDFKEMHPSYFPSSTRGEERFKKPTDEEITKMAVVFNEGNMSTQNLVNIISVCLIIVDRLYENGDILIPSSKEEK